MTQQPLPNMPARKETFALWVEQWMQTYYPEVQTDKTSADVIEEMWEDVPQRWVGSADEALRTRFTTRVQSAFRAITPRRSFLATGAKRNERVIVQPMLFALDDFRRYEVGKLALAKGDVEAVERDVNEYAELNPQAIPDVPAFLAELRLAVGL